MSTVTKLSTTYQQTIREAVDRLLIGQGVAMTLREFAEKANVKPTANLKRRLTELVYEGVLTSFPAYIESGHLATMYREPIHSDEPQQLYIPF